MRRKAFCVVADIEPRRFDTMLTRGQVPFRAKTDGWGKYSVDDAFRMRLILDLIDNHGCSIEIAIYTVANALTDRWLVEYPLREGGAEEDTWVAFSTSSFNVEAGHPVHNAAFAAGLHGVPKIAQGIAEVIADEVGLTRRTEIFDGENGPDIRSVDIDQPEYRLQRVIMANASDAARRVLDNVRQLDIEISAEDIPIVSECDLPVFPEGWQVSPHLLVTTQPIVKPNEAIEGWKTYAEKRESIAA